MVVVAADRETGVDQLRFAAGNGNSVELAAAVIDERASVTRPIRRFEVSASEIEGAAVCRLDVDRFKRAFENRAGGFGLLLLV